MHMTGKQIEKKSQGFFQERAFIDNDGLYITSIYEKNGRVFAQLRHPNFEKFIVNDVDVTDRKFLVITPE